MSKTQFKTEMSNDIPMYRVVARGHRRKLITYVSTCKNLDDINVPNGSTGRIESKKNGKYIVTFDNHRCADAALSRDEFIVLKQKLDMSRKGV